MRITILQTDILWGQSFANQSIAERMIFNCSDSDLYVLPEMWSTGFVTQPKGLAEKEEDCKNSGSLNWMQKMAKIKNAAICGTLSIENDGYFYNRAYFVFPDGNYEYYDKKHLFSMSDEAKYYRAGKERKIINFRGVRFLLITCYDLRFPVWIRNHEDYDAIICMANWPASRRRVWDVLLKARAIENQSYVIGVNRVGSDNECIYTGGSIIIDAYGNEIARCDEEIASMTTTDIDLEKLNRFRAKFSVLKDRDKYINTDNN